ncbi:hypothetical protein PQX77_013498, partial [Marasmius sp. AFHP31]
MDPSDGDPILGYAQFYAALANFELSPRMNGSFYAQATRYFQRGYSLCSKSFWGAKGTTETQNATIRDAMDHGYAAIRWYKARNDSLFHQVALECWELAYQFTVSDATRPSNGVMEVKNFEVPTDCQDKKLAGATFQNGTASDGNLSLYETA